MFIGLLCSCSNRTVEKLDIDRGVWTQSDYLLSRRSTLGVAVLDGKLYAVGGFDGSNGLETVERFDPGECRSGDGCISHNIHNMYTHTYACKCTHVRKSYSVQYICMYVCARCL